MGSELNWYCTFASETAGDLTPGFRTVTSIKDHETMVKLFSSKFANVTFRINYDLLRCTPISNQAISKQVILLTDASQFSVLTFSNHR